MHKRTRLPELTLLVGVAASIVGWLLVRDQVRQFESARFERRVDQVRQTLEGRLRDQQRALNGLAGLLAAQPSIRRGEWQRYVMSLELRDYPGTTGFGFARHVRRESLEGYVERVRRDDAPEFTLKSDTGAAELFVVEYLEPIRRNAAALGFDLGSEKVRREAAVAAVDRGRPILSRRLQLVQDEEAVPGFLLMMPVFKKGMPTGTKADRWTALVGWVFAPLRGPDLMNGIAELTGSEVDFDVYQDDDSDFGNVLFDADGHLAAKPRPRVEANYSGRMFHRRLELDVAGRTWVMHLSTGPEFGRSASRLLAPLTLFSGCSISVLCSTVFWMLGRSGRRATRLAKEMTNELRREISVRESASQELRALSRFQQAIIESAGHAIITTDRAGVIRMMNPAAQRMLSCSEAAVVGKENLLSFHDLKEVAARAAEFGATLSTKLVPGIEVLYVKSLRGLPNEHQWTYISRNGFRIQVMLSVTALRDDHGDVTGFLAMAIDITERETAERRLAAFVEHAPAAVAMFDREMRYIAVSNRWLDDYGLKGARVIGRSHYSVFPSIPDRWKDIHKRCLGGAVETCDDDIWRPVGSDRDQHLRWEVRPWFGADGQVAGLMMFTQDITAEHERELELVGLHEAAEAASKAKSNFLAAMSHEIRTPMNGVLGFTNLLLDTPLSDSQREFVQTIHSSGQSLLALINDILDYSKIEAGRVELENQAFDLEQTVGEVVELLSPSAESKELQLAVQYSPDASRRMFADPGRVRQVFTNLLGNAIKFTDSGYVLVSVEAMTARANGTKWSGVRVSVTDTGIGIAASKIGLLFNKFSQADSSTARKYGGTGLGLAISRQLIELMGGEIGVQSEEGKGSTFWFTLPVDTTAAALRVPAPSDLPAGVRVLVVDDSEINRRVLHHQLTHWGVDHEMAGDGPEALHKLRAANLAGRPFHIALLDHFMPEMPGDELAQRIKADPDLKRTALILLTSAAHRRDPVRLAESGFHAGFVKPIVRMNALLETIVNAAGAVDTGLSAPAAGVANVPEPLRERLAPERPAARHRVLLVEDNMVNQKLASLMLQRLGCRVDHAQNGREAIAMVEQFTYDLVFMDCHMPELDGFEATREIRSLRGEPAEPGRRLPIVALTASVLPEDQERCFRCGMDAFITKPVRSTELDAILREWSWGKKEAGSRGAECGGESPALPSGRLVVKAEPATD